MHIQAAPTQIITHQHSNGTNYRIFLTPDPQGGFVWAWCPEAGVLVGGWAAVHAGGEVRQTAGKRNRVDLDAIAWLIDQARTQASLSAIDAPPA